MAAALLAMSSVVGAASKPSVRVAPTTVKAGAVLTISGKGWPARRGVTLYMGPARSEGDRLTTVKADGAGRFTKEIRINPRLPAGRYGVLACRRQCRVKVSAAVRVASSQSPAPVG